MNPPRRGAPDFILLVLTFLLVGFGIVMVYSSSSAYATFKWNDSLFLTKRQIMWAVIGIISMFVVMNIPYQKLKKWFAPFFLIIVILLLIVLFRDPIKGAKSWIGIGPFGFQPSEFAKLGIILYLSALISKKGEKFRDFHKGLLPVLVIVAFVAGLILLQPDFGTTLIFLFCSLVVIVVGGANLKHLFFSSALVLLFAGTFVGMYLLMTDSADYNVRLGRITSFLDPWADPQNTGFQLIQSLFALGHGGIGGVGLGKSIQKLHYLPEAYNDFIFAIIAEELGLVGSVLFLLVFLALLWRGLIISLRCTDPFGTLVGTGIIGMLGFQAFINIGGVTGSIPITGVTLPFISYGGSSLLICLLSVGILLSISRENNRLKFKQEREQGFKV